MPAQGRSTQGKQVIELHAGDRIVEVTRVAEKEEREDDRLGGDAAVADGEGDFGPEQFELLSVADDD